MTSPNDYPTNKYPETPKCPCFNDSTWASKQAQIEMLANAFGLVFRNACIDNLICVDARAWFAGCTVVTFAAMVSNAPDAYMHKGATKDEISKIALGGLDALDQIHAAAVSYLTSRNKELMDEARA